MTTRDTKPETPVKTAQTTFRIVEALKELDGATVTAIADRLELPKSSAYNYLKTLEHEGYVVSDGRTYELGLRFLDLGAYARTQKKLYDVGKPELRTVADETGELANLLVEENGYGVFIVRERGSDAVSIDSYTGQCVHLHTTALGKTILAYLPPERREQIIDSHGLPAKTDRTITDRESLLDELETIRQREVAYDREERINGLHCVAVPVFRDDRISGAISVSGPSSRLDEDRIQESILPKLRHAATIIELNQTYS
ncbi:IclR family transcriptional regulator [Natrialba asiatica]|uniref:IclR family transcriptional regulator n=1 Tax=Natrialba asiatica (strain ATCC 700177 / DSM 12278 / JCM 9576 / FERM P-10747 / NBRC 102637 / 172P1) TaxID=29540 RepID=M0B3U4_NATA1|nr:IclR family transcriptional regulator [Natrialba asiatica]ELZ05212.1 IclR family transcriptional regulator [Natrialba asiatica DSM 12278]